MAPERLQLPELARLPAYRSIGEDPSVLANPLRVVERMKHSGDGGIAHLVADSSSLPPDTPASLVGYPLTRRLLDAIYL